MHNIAVVAWSAIAPVYPEASAMVRTLLSLLLVVVFALLVVIFSWRNPGTLEIDLAFGNYEVSKSIAFVVTLAIGWVWGLLTALVFIVRLMGDRRRLRKRVRLADAELNNLRSLPIQDAG